MNQSSNDLPQSQNHRYIFAAIVFAICTLLYFADYFLIAFMDAGTSHLVKQHASIIKAVIENLIAGAIAALLLAFTYRWILDWIDPGDRVIEVSPSVITDRLLRNARKSQSYVFIGNTASFVSYAVLPILVESARTSGHPKVITLFLIDPTDEAAIDAYVGHRARVSKASHSAADLELIKWSLPENKKSETLDEVIAKIIASIYMAAYVADYPGINITIYLRRSFTPFRADVSDHEAILTQESATESAVAFSARGHFYGWYQKEADAQKGQGTSFDFTALRDRLRNLALAHPTEPSMKIKNSIQTLLKSIDYLAPIANNEVGVSEAAKLISRPKRLYT